MSTFLVVRRKGAARHGTYRTRDVIVSCYDAYARGDTEAWFRRDEERAAKVHQTKWKRGASVAPRRRVVPSP